MVGSCALRGETGHTASTEVSTDWKNFHIRHVNLFSILFPCAEEEMETRKEERREKGNHDGNLPYAAVDEASVEDALEAFSVR